MKSLTLGDMQCLEIFLKDRIEIQRKVSGHFHTLWIAQGQKARYAIKRYEKQELELVALSAMVNNLLFEHGLPVPRVFNRGPSLFCKCENGLYLLQEYISGEHVYAQYADWEKIGILLGKLHCQLGNLPDSIKQFIPVYHVPNIESLYKLLETEVGKEYRIEILQKILIYKEWTRWKHRGFKATYETGIIHGDFYLGNLVRLCSKYYVIDFDGIEVFAPLYEVVKNFVRCFYAGASDLYKTCARNFLSGYASVRSVSLEQFVSAFELFFRVQVACSYYFDPSYSISFIRLRINELNRLLKDESQIINIVASVLGV